MDSSILLAPWLRYWAIVLLFIVASMAFVYVIVEFVLLDPREDKVHALCDHAVEALLTSNDLVEVTRAGIVIRYMNCSVSRRVVSSAFPR